MPYSGPERRIYKVLVTRNTEYHMRGAECIAVRDTKSGEWKKRHVALGSRLVGSIGAGSTGKFSISAGIEALVGSRLCFSSDLLTSPVLTVRRPSHDTAARYRVA